MLTLANLAYVLTVMPFETKLMNITEIINEVTILLVAYHLLFFSDFITNPNVEYDVGWSPIILILASILFNLVIFVYMATSSTIMCIRR